MYGLRVQVSGRPPVTMALNLKSYQVSACAFARWRRRGKKPTFEFVGSGMDDRTDFLKWFSVEPSAGWMEITPVEITTADPPRRHVRRIASRLRLQRSLVRTRRAIADITRRLQRPEWQPTLSPIPRPPQRADFGFVVTLDDRVIGSAGIGGRGGLSIDVFLKRSGRRLALRLHVHGGEYFGPLTYRWRRWAWGEEREIDVGQRVRIKIGRPGQLDLGEVREVRRYLPTTRREARERLADLRRELENHARSQRETKKYQQSRPPPRAYPRMPIRAD
jgi:hypothetical protein